MSETADEELDRAYNRGFQSALDVAADKAREVGRAISKGTMRRAGPNDQGELTAKAIKSLTEIVDD